MHYCDLTLPSPEENLACDEALLDLAEDDGGACLAGSKFEGILRFWESPSYFVVLGYGKELAKEASVEFCGRNAIPILRRCTGGGTVLQGPGVLNYALILDVNSDPSLRSISSTNQFVMDAHRRMFCELLNAPVEVCGHTDLAIGGLKFSGNAQRRRSKHILFHGSLLLHMDMDLMERVLPMPVSQPAYRVKRRHSEFLMNLAIGSSTIKQQLRNVWQANDPIDIIPRDRIAQLAEEKYSKEAWNARI